MFETVGNGKPWTTVVFAIAVIASVLLVAAILKFATVEPRVLMPWEGAKEPMGSWGNRTLPENVTILQTESISFSIFLNTTHVEVAKGQSVDLSFTIYTSEDVNLLLRVGPETYVPSSAPEYLQPKLPSGITSSLTKIRLDVEADTETVVTFTLSVEDSVATGIYPIRISAVQQTNELQHSFKINVS